MKDDNVCFLELNLPTAVNNVILRYSYPDVSSDDEITIHHVKELYDSGMLAKLRGIGIKGLNKVKKALDCFYGLSEPIILPNPNDVKIKNNLINLISNLVETRESLGFSQDDYCYALGMKKNDLIRFEKINSIPRLNTFIKMADVLGLEVVLKKKK